MSATLMGCLLCVICTGNSFHSLLYKPCIHYKYQQNSLAGVCEGGRGDGVCGQLIYIISPNRYVNIQSVLRLHRSRGEFGLVCNSMQGSHRLEKYLNKYMTVLKVFENKICLEKYLKTTQRP